MTINSYYGHLVDMLNAFLERVSLTEELEGNREKSQVVDFFHALKKSESRKSGLSVR